MNGTIKSLKVRIKKYQSQLREQKKHNKYYIDRVKAFDKLIKLDMGFAIDMKIYNEYKNIENDNATDIKWINKQIEDLTKELELETEYFNLIND